MAITKAELHELVQDIMLGGDPSAEAKLHPAIINKVADFVRDDMMVKSYFEARNDGARAINGEFFRSYIVPISKESSTDRVVAKLPVKIISLPHGRGLRAVSPVKEANNHFNIIDIGGTAVFQDLEVNSVRNDVDVYQEGDNLYFEGLKGLKGVKNVRVLMLASITDLDEEEAIPLPGGSEAEFLEKVKEMLRESKATSQDKYNDGNPNQNDDN